jgi:hypothetical protein
VPFVQRMIGGAISSGIGVISAVARLGVPATAARVLVPIDFSAGMLEAHTCL